MSDEYSNSFGHYKMILSIIIGFQRFFGQCYMLISDMKSMYCIYHKSSVPTDHLET